jgi:hypothetical protein
MASKARARALIRDTSALIETNFITKRPAEAETAREHLNHISEKIVPKLSNKHLERLEESLIIARYHLESQNARAWPSQRGDLLKKVSKWVDTIVATGGNQTPFPFED